ncbi:heme exporter protein CcmD [Natrinema salaciae]|uniref:Uncharacterized protein n=1 Tax=Natrinema salaciae TaxID=1186196 RepID=A0A1H9MJW8_9EURY|nr:heme exporter protein CcmD [Natrinema salaciae]SER23841.1 hypothetical protein SAMN04489841_3386 [Natrinema salaciae]
MSIRIQLGSDDGEDAQSPDDEDDEHQTIRQWFLNTPDLGGIFIRSTLVFAALTALSMIGMAMLLLAVSEDPFVDQPTVEDPIIAYVWLVSFTAMALSIFGYVAWSFWKQRQLKKQLTTSRESSLIEKPIRTLQIAFADSSDLDEYERQVQKTVFALLIGVVFGNLPIRMTVNILLSL